MKYVHSVSPIGFKLKSLKFYQKLSPNGKYFFSLVIANYKNKLQNDSTLEHRCIVTMRQLDETNEGKIIVQQSEKFGDLSLLYHSKYFQTFMDDDFAILCSNTIVNIRSITTLKTVKTITTYGDALADYSNGYFISYYKIKYCNNWLRPDESYFE